jgi:hypothetical protein
MKKRMARVKMLLLLTMAYVLAIVGMRAPAHAQTCPAHVRWYCTDVYEVCQPAPGCGIMLFTYYGICNGVPTYTISCAVCSLRGMGYCQ